MKFLSRAKAEKFLCACNYDFAIANELSALCHFNFFFLMNTIERFGGDYKEACLYLKNVRNSQSRNQTTTHCKTALEILQSFRGNEIVASNLLKKFKNDTIAVQAFLTKFDANGEEASSFLSTFENDVERTNNFLSKFNDKRENANEYLKKFANVTEGETFLQKFADENEANEFIHEFNDSTDCASQFVKSFNNSKEAIKHLEAIKRECDEKTDNSCGDNCKWIFDEKTKTLFIRGRGKMNNYGWNDKGGVPTTPWSSIRKQIENVVISQSITTIGDYGFSFCSSLTSIIIPNSVIGIGPESFVCCSSLASVDIQNELIKNSITAFLGCPITNFKIAGKDLTTLARYCKNLLLIKNLPLMIHQNDLETIFLDLNPVLCRIGMTPNGKCNGLGFACFKTNEEAANAFEKVRGTRINDNEMIIEYSGAQLNTSKVVTDNSFDLDSYKTKDEKKVYVGNIDFKATDADLLELFKEYHPQEAHVVRSKSGRNKGFGFVTFETSEAAQNALSLNGTKMLERVITCSVAYSRVE